MFNITVVKMEVKNKRKVKEKLIAFRLAEAELKQLKDYASKTKLNVSQFIRLMTIGQA
ncbi:MULTISPECIES: plasmid mobilization protein [Flavobacterium]|uniref:Ribbon-helix-helix protein, copG family n=1 Tax=Flavobacterium keumense TaxID=1306518 RepID=A0ABY8N3Z5_9FLAO|nr:MULTISPECIES: hypothetical protein [Flavobacterium]WGK94252.1 hypothetical protein MG292_09215 [Flavobacterium keumense]